MPDDVRELVGRCLARDELAIAELIERFHGQVFGLCYRMLAHRQDAEDVAQESFVRAVRNLHRWDSTRDFRPWLLAIAGNRCRTHLSTRRRRGASLAEMDHVVDRAPPSADALAEEVARALDELRDEHRQAFVMFHEQQLNYAEIAEALDCPVGTVKTWVHRARRELAQRLRERGVVEEVHNAVR